MASGTEALFVIRFSSTAIGAFFDWETYFGLGDNKSDPSRLFYFFDDAFSIFSGVFDLYGFL